MSIYFYCIFGNEIANLKFEKGMNLRVLLLNWLQLSHFQRLKANLFHSIIIAGKKKKFLKKFWFVLKYGMLPDFLHT